MFVRFWMVFSICLALSAWSQTPPPAAEMRDMSLGECVTLALQKNLNLQIQQLSLDIAGRNLSGAYGAYIPSFSFQIRKDHVEQPLQVDPQKPNPDYPYEMDAPVGVSSLSGMLPYGFSYELGASLREADSTTDFSMNPGLWDVFPGGIRTTNQYYANLGVNVRQKLLKDFWIDPTREMILLRRKDLKISEQALRLQTMSTILAVEIGYYDLVAARESVRVQEKALELRQQTVAETKRRVELGDLPPLDNEQVETQLQNTLTTLAAAREAYAAQQNTLKTLFTDDFMVWASVEINPTDAIFALPPALDRPESFRKALYNRPDLAEARLAVEKGDVVVRFQKNQLFPSLDFIGRYGGLGVQPELSGAVNDAANFRYKNYFYGAVLTVPLSNLKERNNYEASKDARRIAELQLRKAEQEVLLQVADFVNRSGSRFSQTASTRKARAFAEAALAAEEKKLANGLSTTFVVLQLQETLTTARLAEVQALVEFNKAMAQLAFYEGTTLDRHHLALSTK
jgi:HAE1 family hydrophobic/amphiphilic exporter-1